MPAALAALATAASSSRWVVRPKVTGSFGTMLAMIFAGRLARTIKVEPAGTGNGPLAAALPGPVGSLLAADRIIGGLLV